jgi:hypothetical protein
MAKHAAGPGHPAFQITDVDRGHPAKHRQDKAEKADKPRLTLMLTDVIKAKEVARTG